MNIILFYKYSNNYKYYIITLVTYSFLSNITNNKMYISLIISRTPHMGGPVAFSTAIITCIGYYLLGAESCLI